MVDTHMKKTKGRRKSKLSKYTPFDFLNVFLLAVLGISMLYPILNMVITSFSDMTDVVSAKFGMIFPTKLNLDSYRYVFRFSDLWKSYGITIIITLAGTFINLIMSTLAAYVLSEKQMPGRNLMMGYVLVTMFFSGGLIPSFLVISSLGLVNTLWSLIIPGAISTWNMIIMRNFFQGLPISLKESARIDGAGEFKILSRIILPLSKPVLATMTLFYGVGHWNEYTSAIIYINDSTKYPLQVVIRRMYEQTLGQISADILPPPAMTVRAATVVLATLPILCVYPFIQKYFVKGIMIGALKG